MQHKDSLLEVIKTLFAYRRFILLITGVVAVGSVIISLLLPVYYQSSTTFLSVNPDLLTERGVFGTTKNDPQPFGNNNDNDRLLNIATSHELEDYLIRRFDLYTHYDIDTSNVRAPFTISEKLAGLFDAKRTKLDAIELSVEDQDPEFASAMAKAARQKIDEINLEMAKSVQKSTIAALKQVVTEKNKRLNILSDTIQEMRDRYGIYNISSQTETLAALLTTNQARTTNIAARVEALKGSRRVRRDSILYLEASLKGLEGERGNLQVQLTALNQGMSKVQALGDEYDQAVLYLTYDKEQLQKLQAAYNSQLSSVIVVEEASIPIVKARPKRSTIVLAATMAALLFSIIGVLVIDLYRNVRWEEVFES